MERIKAKKLKKTEGIEDEKLTPKVTDSVSREPKTASSCLLEIHKALTQALWTGPSRLQDFKIFHRLPELLT